MSNIKIDFNNTIGKIKPMHAVGQPPFSGGFLSFDFSRIQHLKDAHIPYSRLHDVGGAFGSGRFVDIPNIFRNFDADETDPESYDFAFTDVLLAAMAEYGITPYFRLGVTIENQAHIKAYNIHPPKDYNKWARVCEHIIRHYNEGWADGFHYDIKYWEIWNEPENGIGINNQMWTGTDEDYFRLYDVTAKHLKKCFGDTIKVGGYASCGFSAIAYDPQKYGSKIPKRERTAGDDEYYNTALYRLNFFFNFLNYIKKNKSPIDFFSYHSYSEVEKTYYIELFVEKTLREYGFDDVEIHLNEWNNAHTPLLHGKSYSSANTAAMMCRMQNTDIDMMCYYDTRIEASAYGGFFAPLTADPVCTYYSFYAFGELFALETQVDCEVQGEGIYALASTDGSKKATLIVNCTDKPHSIETNLDPSFDVYLIDEDHFVTKTDSDPRHIEARSYGVYLIKNY